MTISCITHFSTHISYIYFKQNPDIPINPNTLVCTSTKRWTYTKISVLYTDQNKRVIHEANGEGNGNPLQYSLPGESHGWRSLVCYSPQGRKESDTTERLHLRGRREERKITSSLVCYLSCNC